MESSLDALGREMQHDHVSTVLYRTSYTFSAQGIMKSVFIMLLVFNDFHYDKKLGFAGVSGTTSF